MPNPMILGIGASVGGSLLSGNAQANAAESASAAQVEGTRLSIAEQRRQFNLMRQLSQPYVTAGGKGLSGVLGLMGLNGNAAQQQAINGIQGGAEFGSMVRAGEDAITSNASATGGLRGGNTEAALAQFRPQILSDLINKQMGNLQGLSTMGQNAAAGVGSAAMTMGNNVSQAYGDAAAARAGNYLARGQATSNMIGAATGGFGQIMGGIQPPAGASMFGQWGF
jgi:hypothetical protein